MLPSAASPHDSLIRRWRRRVTLGLAVGGLADGLGALALAGAVTLVVLRAFHVSMAPHPLWLIALLVPVGVALWRVRRRLPSASVAATHLDRRLGLGGLLLTGVERDVSAWADRLTVGATPLLSALPRVRWGRAAARATLPLALLVAVVALPPPQAHAQRGDEAVLRALDRLGQRVEELKAAHGLRQEVRQELAERLGDLERRRDQGKELTWADVDLAGDRAEQEAARQSAELAKAAASLRASAERTRLDPEAGRGELASLLSATATLDLASGLDPSLTAAAGLDALGQLDPTASAVSDADAATLAALAELADAMAGEAADRFAQLQSIGAVHPAEIEALKALLACSGCTGEGGSCGACSGSGTGNDGTSCGECGGRGVRPGLREGPGLPGRGGINRGRGDAHLALTGSTPDADAAGAPQRLPPGARAPAPTIRLAERMGEPHAPAVRDESAGSAGDIGTGAVAWRRRIAPRHRDAVRSYFGSAPTTMDPAAGSTTRGPATPAPAPGSPDTAPPAAPSLPAMDR